MTIETTMLDLITAVAEVAENENEVLATVVYLVNSGRVRLCGSFRGERFDPNRLAAAAA